MTRNKKNVVPQYRYRRFLVLTAFALLLGILLWRALDLQILDRDFLQRQGDARHMRVVEVPAHRGEIYDRNGQPLALSTPVDSIWAQPDELLPAIDRLGELAKVADLDLKRLRSRVRANSGREFMYIARHVHPEVAQQVKALGLPGVALMREYRRYYPAGEVNGPLIGFTNIDDRGQEGLELAYNDWLTGKPGAKRVIRDRLGQLVEDIERIRAAEPGRDIHLSIDQRLQYLAYRELKAAVKEHNAVSASVVLLDINTGEVLAMSNLPSFNPNKRDGLRPGVYRNRAVTDVFEPGSTMKPVTVAAALESGRWSPDDRIHTSPGYMQVQGKPIRDLRDYAELDVAGVIFKSSNVGITKIALSLEPEEQWRMFHDLGLGSGTNSGFPGEAAGHIKSPDSMGNFERAAMAFGYGLAVTPLQLTRAYAAVAADGVLRPVSFLRKNKSVKGVSVMSVETARQLRSMMESVAGPGGTGLLAHVPNYRVAGKTGTIHKSVRGGYADNSYYSVFVGIAPATKPRFAMAIVVNDPRNGDYFGGKVAAPVFSKVMAGALRLQDVPPDDMKLRQAEMPAGDGSA